MADILGSQGAPSDDLSCTCGYTCGTTSALYRHLAKFKNDPEHQDKSLARIGSSNSRSFLQDDAPQGIFAVRPDDSAMKPPASPRPIQEETSPLRSLLGLEANASINCKCGAVEVEFKTSKALYRLDCCCYDCTAALQYAHFKKGGPQPPQLQLADSVWFPNDFTILRGENKIGAFKNFASGSTVRFYCKSCWTVMFADFPLFQGKILVTQINSYKEFRGLKNAELMPPFARHMMKDLSKQQLRAMPPYSGYPSNVYWGAADNFTSSTQEIVQSGSAGAEMNCQILLARIGEPLIPDDDPILAAGPPTLMAQMAGAADQAEAQVSSVGASINCKCGAVKVAFKSTKALSHLECCCYDCSAALRYAHEFHGGPTNPEEQIVDCVYLPNDFTVERGGGKIGAFKNFASGSTVRFHCKDCWTVLFADHPKYQGKILATQITSYEEFHGLQNAEVMDLSARHMTKDLGMLQEMTMSRYTGDPSNVYVGVAENWYCRSEEFLAYENKGEGMNTQVLLQQIGVPSVPRDDPLLAAGPTSASASAMQAVEQVPLIPKTAPVLTRALTMEERFGWVVVEPAAAPEPTPEAAPRQSLSASEEEEASARRADSERRNAVLRQEAEQKRAESWKEKQLAQESEAAARRLAEAEAAEAEAFAAEAEAAEAQAQAKLRLPPSSDELKMQTSSTREKQTSPSWEEMQPPLSQISEPLVPSAAIKVAAAPPVSVRCEVVDVRELSKLSTHYEDLEARLARLDARIKTTPKGTPVKLVGPRSPSPASSPSSSRKQVKKSSAASSPASPGIAFREVQPADAKASSFSSVANVGKPKAVDPPSNPQAPLDSTSALQNGKLSASASATELDISSSDWAFSYVEGSLQGSSGCHAPFLSMLSLVSPSFDQSLQRRRELDAAKKAERDAEVDAARASRQSAMNELKDLAPVSESSLAASPGAKQPSSAGPIDMSNAPLSGVVPKREEIPFYADAVPGRIQLPEEGVRISARTRISSGNGQEGDDDDDDFFGFFDCCTSRKGPSDMEPVSVRPIR